MRTPPKSVLIIVARRLGDVLLTTPLIRSIKHAWPEAAVDVLVFEGTQAVLAANPDVRKVLTVRERPGLLEHLGFLLRLLRRYDFALSTQHGDRPTLYAFLAGRWRAGLLMNTPKEHWKRPLLHAWAPFDDRNTHTVNMNLALAGLIGIQSRREIVVSWSPEDAARVDALLGAEDRRPIAVLHPFPKFNYKMWHQGGWGEIARWLAVRGCRIVLSGGPDAAETAYIADLGRDMPSGTSSLAGRLSLGESGYLLSRAVVFVGPDTAVTHMAAALGVPTVALYGPTNPVKWGPWPKDYAFAANPWKRLGSQAVCNVTLIQGNLPCVPCHLEGCERNVQSFSDCLLQLPAATVIKALESALHPR
jgi:heptosyltransferase-3